MKKGDRVLFVAPWSSYRAQYAEVVTPPPGLMVLLDGDQIPIAARADEVIPDAPSEISMTGAE